MGSVPAIRCIPSSNRAPTLWRRFSSINFSMQTNWRFVLPAAIALTASTIRAQDTQIRGFADVTYRTGSKGTPAPAFGLGQYDLFITSKLTPQFRFIGETVFEYDGEGFIVDVERVIVSYTPREWFKVGAGKHHTPIGFWNNAYHHGAVMQPTIERPLMFKFEDEGGVLPIHTVGLLLSGNNIGVAHLTYDFLIGNGIGSTPISDNNRSNSYTAALRSQITSTLEVGISGYTDRAGIGTVNLAGDTLALNMTQRMFGGFVSYLGAKNELIAEYQRVMNRSEGARSHDTDAMFIYAGHRIGRFVPYVRYDMLGYQPGDPYFAVNDTKMALVGGRYDFGPMTTVKLEGRRRDAQDIGVTRDLVAQVAIGF